jgi:NADH-quinone oxidoreductase subunit J
MFTEILFFIFALLALAGAILTITQRNPLISGLFLVMTFCSIAFIYFMLNAQLIAIFQIIIYAGAIMVLFIFVIMLLNLARLPGVSFRAFFTKVLGVVLALLLIGTVITLLNPALPTLGSSDELNLMKKSDFTVEEGSPSTISDNNIKQFGWRLFTKWVYPFEIISIILLVGIIGAVLFSKREIK